MADQTAIPGVIEAMETCRAVRRFLPEPVPPELVERLVYAATRAPSASNQQPWAFVVAADPELKRALAAATTPRSIASLERLLPGSSGSQRRMYEESLHLARTLGEVPLLIFVCATGIDRTAEVDPRVWLGVLPAAQNLLVAARALGLGTTLATYHLHAEAEVRRLLRLPSDALVAATIAAGRPAAPFSPVRRRPVSEVLHWNGW